MTTVAILAESPKMDILCFMTAETGGGEIKSFLHLFFMTGEAFQPLVGTIQLELRLEIMIKTP